MDNSSHHHLVRILQSAYSGELAAAYAYRGHWKSLKDSNERERIRQIEEEEWIHRKRVGRMLDELGAEPVKFREALMWAVGRVIGIACHLIGWFLPMYFAGRLESGNVEEYESAAFHAAKLNRAQFEGDLRVMAHVEKEHEIFFASVVARHRLLPLAQMLFVWGPDIAFAVEQVEPEMPPQPSSDSAL